MWGRMDPWPDTIDACRPVLGLVVALLISVGWAATARVSRCRAPHLAGRHQPVPGRRVLDPEVVAVVHGRGRPDHAQHQVPPREITADRTRACTSNGCATETGTACRVSAGVDPQGWTAGLQRFVDVRYRLVAADSFMGALRLAVTRMRKLNLPVALTVVARQPRLGAPRVHCDGRSREDLELHDHQRPGQRAAVGAPEQQLRLRHAAQHQADRHAAQAASSRNGGTPPSG